MKSAAQTVYPRVGGGNLSIGGQGEPGEGSIPAWAGDAATPVPPSALGSQRVSSDRPTQAQQSSI